jgi:hypothetical protein
MSILFLNYLMIENKHNHQVHPDTTKLKAVIIDARTVIYIPLDADPVKARARYWSHRPVPIGSKPAAV